MEFSPVDFRDVQNFEDLGIELNKAFGVWFNTLSHNNVKQLYTNYCNIQSENGETVVDGPTIRFYGTDTSLQRMNVGYDTIGSDFGFWVKDISGNYTAYLDSTGRLIVTRLESGYISGSTIVGGAITGSTISGSNIIGSTIVGGTIKTAEIGARIQMSGNAFLTYNSSNNFNGMVFGSSDSASDSTSFGDIYFYDNGSPTMRFYNALLGGGWNIEPYGTGALGIGAVGKNTLLIGNIRQTDRIGFFNSTAVGKTSVSDPSAWVDVSAGADTVDLIDLNTKVSAIRDKLDDLIDALQSYGLV